MADLYRISITIDVLARADTLEHAAHESDRLLQTAVGSVAAQLVTADGERVLASGVTYQEAR